MFSCEFCEIPKNIFSYRTPLVAASDITHFETLSESFLQFTQQRERKYFHAYLFQLFENNNQVISTYQL